MAQTTGAPIASPAAAIWNQRERIASLREKIKSLSAAVGSPSDFSLYQWAQITAFALEFRPDLIIELGRGFGNSTCCFLEVANQLGGRRACKILSLCLSDLWFKTTVPRLRGIVPGEWFVPGEILQCDILDYDFSVALEGAQRCLVLWDAHGFEIAECVLGNLLPRLSERSHVILMHDMLDARTDNVSREYGGTGELWNGENSSASYFWLGHIVSNVQQAISIVDFTTRNTLPLHSAASSIHEEIANSPVKLAILRELIGDEFSSLEARWFWFTLNEAPGRVVFPRFTRRLTTREKGLQGENHLAPGPPMKAYQKALRRLAPGGTRRRTLFESMLRNLRRQQP